ncbi:hypothetical protein [Streptomyces sp. NPDC048256]|uniref:hypothetical protein n=1 Tax=Streptomyces sp. NPDC048256 TaxID=3154613 RepID=UPI0033F54CBA
MPLAEAQSHWVADLLEGRCALPGREEMLDEIHTYRARTARVTSPRPGTPSRWTRRRI